MIDLDSSIGAVLTEFRGEGGKLIVKRTQDTTAILEANKAELSGAPTWRPYAGMNMRKVASIPNIVAEQWMREGVNVFSTQPDQRRKVAAKLNSNEWAHLRTYPGKVGHAI